MIEFELPTADLGATLARKCLPVLVAVGVLSAGVVGWAIVGTLDDGEDAVLVAGPPYALWRTLIGITVAVSVGATLYTVPLFVGLRRRYPSASLLALNIIFLVAIVLAASLPLSYWGRFGTVSTRLIPVVVIVAVTLWPAIAIVWLIRARVRYMASERHDMLADAAALRITELRALHSALGTALTVLAVVVSISVINTGQLRNARIAAGTAPSEFSTATALLYGAVLAGLLGLLYLPVHRMWRMAGTRVVDAVYPLVPPDSDDKPILPDQEWETGRLRLVNLIGLGTTGAAQFKAAFATLSPLITVLIAYFLPSA